MSKPLITDHAFVRNPADPNNCYHTTPEQYEYGGSCGEVRAAHGEPLPKTEDSNVIQELYEVIADEGCFCPGENIPEPGNHVCLPGRAEYVVKLLLAERDALRAEVERLKGELVESQHMEGLALNAFDDKCEMVPDAQYQIAVAYGIEQCNRADKLGSALTALRTRMEGEVAWLENTSAEFGASPYAEGRAHSYKVCIRRLAAILAETKL